uniref:Uncharacterized protein n=1 Tax=Oryza nivara TaxID=4536 RepID=A0A0E0HMF8_ORYNI
MWWRATAASTTRWRVTAAADPAAATPRADLAARRRRRPPPARIQRRLAHARIWRCDGGGGGQPTRGSGGATLSRKGEWKSMVWTVEVQWRVYTIQHVGIVQAGSKDSTRRGQEKPRTLNLDCFSCGALPVDRKCTTTAIAQPRDGVKQKKRTLKDEERGRDEPFFCSAATAAIAGGGGEQGEIRDELRPRQIRTGGRN